MIGWIHFLDNLLGWKIKKILIKIPWEEVQKGNWIGITNTETGDLDSRPFCTKMELELKLQKAKGQFSNINKRLF